jgi:DNA-binding Lrp family transcriptional regulator
MKLDDIDKKVLACAQGDLDVCERPLDKWADKLGISVEEVISRLRALKEKGVIREIKAVLRHRKAGFTANAMVVWAVPPDQVEELGARIASSASVSHCYEREGFAPYTVFSMIHARSKDEIIKTVGDISSLTGIRDYRIFWSIRELKKTSMRYSFQEDSCDE